MSTFQNDHFKLLYQISAVNSQSPDIQLDAILKIATKIFNLDIGIISKIQGDTYEIVNCFHIQGRVKKGDTFEKGLTYCDITLNSDGFQAIHNMGQSAFATHPCYQNFKLEAYIGIALQVNGRLYGTLNFSSSHPRRSPFITEDKETIEIMGTWVSNILANMENMQALKDQKYRYQNLIDKSGLLLYTHDLQGNITQANYHMCKELGYPEKKIIGKNLSDFTLDAKAIQLYLNRISKVGQAEGKFTIINSNRQVRYLSYKNTLEGNHVLGFSQEITQQVQMQQALEESERSLKEAQSIARIGSWTLDIDDEKITWSEEAFRISGISPQDGVPTMEDYQKMLHPDDISKSLQVFEQAILKGTPYAIDYRIIINGKTKYMQAHGRPLKDARGNITHLVGTFQDITQRHEINQELIKAKETAESAAKIKQEFLANMSHEIRTPMNAILGFSRILLKDELKPKDQTSYLQSIYDSAETLLVIINDILDFSKIEAGKLSIVPTHFDLYKLLHQLYKLFSVRVDESQVRLVFDDDSKIPKAVFGDPTRINQVLSNLISNSIKFTERGKVEVKTRILQQKENDIQIQFIVSDTGIGIASNRLGKIFSSFEQAESDTTRRFGGTGLGLTIVKSIVELMGGNIHLESELGKGSTFYIELPLKLGDQKKIQLDGVAVNQILAIEHLKGTKILLAEDNRNNQILATKYLTDAGCLVDVASNGLEAIRCAKEKSFDIILMDIQMPEMDGLQATEHLMNEHLGICPIIAMTAHALKEEENKFMQMGMSDYISKPFKPEILYAKLLNALNKKVNINSSEAVIENEDAYEDKDEINFSAFEQMAGDDSEFIRQMINIFLQDVPGYLKEIEVSLSVNDFQSLKQTAHTLKSSVTFLGMEKTMSALEALDNDDLTNLEDQLIIEYCQRVTDQCKKAISLLQEQLKNLSKPE